MAIASSSPPKLPLRPRATAGPLPEFRSVPRHPFFQGVLEPAPFCPAIAIFPRVGLENPNRKNLDQNKYFPINHSKIFSDFSNFKKIQKQISAFDNNHEKKTKEN